jgi:hypothetical protein
MSGEDERGSGLILALFVLLLLTGMGIALLFLSQNELKMSRANVDAKRAFQYAESGLEDGRMTLFTANGSGSFSDDLATAGGADGVIDFDPDLLQATFDADGNPTGLSGYDDDVPLRPVVPFGTSAAPGLYAAFLTNDPTEGESTVADSNNRVMLTGVGLGPRRSQEIVQAIIEPLRPVYDPPPAAITLLGPTPSFDNGRSNAQSHDGNDCGGSGIPGIYAPIVGTVSSNATGQVQGDMQRPEHFSSGPFTGTNTVGDLTDPTDPIVAGSGLGTIDPGWTDCASLKQLVLELIATADYYCNTDLGGCSIPATSPGDITVIDGDLSTPGNTTHHGILLVTGQLTYNGNSQWNGLILVIGEGYILRNGGGGGNPSGGVVVANIDPSPSGTRTDKSDWCSTSPDGFGQAQYETQGGGNSTVFYCSQHLNSANQVQTYKVVEFLQR